jgi:hypothetical protein
MATNTILNINSIENELHTTLNYAARDIEKNRGTDFFEMNLKNNIESKMSSWAQTLNSKNNNCIGCPPGTGFKVTLGLQILVSYKVRVRANLNIGYGQRSGNFSGSGSLHFAAYNGGLGTAFGSSNLVVDITAAANIVVGTGSGMPLQSYSLNYNSPIGLQNDFNKSLGYGQLLTWNSAQSEGKFSLDDIQREGMIGFRIGDVNVSSNNDTRRAYFGGGTDKAWTGGLSIVTPFMEVGFQDFSGDYLRNGKDRQTNDDIDRGLMRSKDENKNPFVERFHRQTDYQKSLNKASTYFRLNSNGANITLDVIGDAWLQNGIHKAIKDFKFEYEHKKIELWGGFQF